MLSVLLVWMQSMKGLWSLEINYIVKAYCFGLMIMFTNSNLPNNPQSLPTDRVSRMDSCAKYETSHKLSPSEDLCNILTLSWK